MKWCRSVFALILAVAFWSPAVWAYEVIKVKGDRVLVKLHGQPTDVGEIYEVYSSSNRMKGRVTITQVRGDRAIANITDSKDVIVVGDNLRQGGSSSSSVLSSPRRRSSDRGFLSRPAWTGINGRMIVGLMGGVQWASLEVKDIYFEEDGAEFNLDLDGVAWATELFWDYHLTPWLWLRATTGIMDVKTEADGGNADSCAEDEPGPGDETCVFEVLYSRSTIWGRVGFSQHPVVQPWVGVSVGLLIPFDKTSQIVDEDSIKAVGFFGMGGGIDIRIKKITIPIQVTYEIIPGSDTVKFHNVVGTIGLGFNF